ncbi:Nucleotidyl cyclase [Giardia muris]|uniref:adenylate cyclase n=1 Tax=Giardia muris TaxID=5742 RepID=A0A4Z1T9S3_GIAMU|nr:Nucleotidyl cyclase [Giardia muris]|eukprot:TNJ29917.1 Nucleotidyl cyclase [Giardia muris]
MPSLRPCLGSRRFRTWFMPQADEDLIYFLHLGIQYYAFFVLTITAITLPIFYVGSWDTKLSLIVGNSRVVEALVGSLLVVAMYRSKLRYVCDRCRDKSEIEYLMTGCTCVQSQAIVFRRCYTLALSLRVLCSSILAALTTEYTVIPAFMELSIQLVCIFLALVAPVAFAGRLVYLLLLLYPACIIVYKLSNIVTAAALLLGLVLCLYAMYYFVSFHVPIPMLDLKATYRMVTAMAVQVMTLFLSALPLEPILRMTDQHYVLAPFVNRQVCFAYIAISERTSRDSDTYPTVIATDIDADTHSFMSRLNVLYCSLDFLSEVIGVQKVKSTYTLYMAASGLQYGERSLDSHIRQFGMKSTDHCWFPPPLTSNDHFKLMVTFCLAAKKIGDDLNFNVSAGITRGSVITGMLGQEHAECNFDVWGDTVNMAARIARGFETGVFFKRDDFFDRHKYMAQPRSLEPVTHSPLDQTELEGIKPIDDRLTHKMREILTYLPSPSITTVSRELVHSCPPCYRFGMIYPRIFKGKEGITWVVEVTETDYFPWVLRRAFGSAYHRLLHAYLGDCTRKYLRPRFWTFTNRDLLPSSHFITHADFLGALSSLEESLEMQRDDKQHIYYIFCATRLLQRSKAQKERATKAGNKRLGYVPSHIPTEPSPSGESAVFPINDTYGYRSYTEFIRKNMAPLDDTLGPMIYSVWTGDYSLLPLGCEFYDLKTTFGLRGTHRKRRSAALIDPMTGNKIQRLTSSRSTTGISTSGRTLEPLEAIKAIRGKYVLDPSEPLNFQPSFATSSEWGHLPSRDSSKTFDSSFTENYRSRRGLGQLQRLLIESPYVYGKISKNYIPSSRSGESASSSFLDALDGQEKFHPTPYFLRKQQFPGKGGSLSYLADIDGDMDETTSLLQTDDPWHSIGDDIYHHELSHQILDHSDASSVHSLDYHDNFTNDPKGSVIRNILKRTAGPTEVELDLPLLEDSDVPAQDLRPTMEREDVIVPASHIQSNGQVIRDSTSTLSSVEGNRDSFSSNLTSDERKPTRTAIQKHTTQGPLTIDNQIKNFFSILSHRTQSTPNIHYAHAQYLSDNAINYGNDDSKDLEAGPLSGSTATTLRSLELCGDDLHQGMGYLEGDNPPPQFSDYSYTTETTMTEENHRVETLDFLSPRIIAINVYRAWHCIKEISELSKRVRTMCAANVDYAFLVTGTMRSQYYWSDVFCVCGNFFCFILIVKLSGFKYEAMISIFGITVTFSSVVYIHVAILLLNLIWLVIIFAYTRRLKGVRQVVKHDLDIANERGIPCDRLGSELVYHQLIVNFRAFVTFVTCFLMLTVQFFYSIGFDSTLNNSIDEKPNVVALLILFAYVTQTIYLVTILTSNTSSPFFISFNYVAIFIPLLFLLTLSLVGDKSAVFFDIVFSLLALIFVTRHVNVFSLSLAWKYEQIRHIKQYKSQLRSILPSMTIDVMIATNQPEAVRSTEGVFQFIESYMRDLRYLSTMTEMWENKTLPRVATVRVTDQSDSPYLVDYQLDFTALTTVMWDLPPEIRDDDAQILLHLEKTATDYLHVTEKRRQLRRRCLNDGLTYVAQLYANFNDPRYLPPNRPIVCFGKVGYLSLDIVNFTKLSSDHSATTILDFLNALFSLFNQRIRRSAQLLQIKSIGDAYEVMSLPGYLKRYDSVDGRTAEKKARREEIDELLQLYDGIVLLIAAGFGFLRDCKEIARKHNFDEATIGLRVGICTGFAFGSLLGNKQYRFDVFGSVPNRADAVQSVAMKDTVYISEQVHQLLVSGEKLWRQNFDEARYEQEALKVHAAKLEDEHLEYAYTPVQTALGTVYHVTIPDRV